MRQGTRVQRHPCRVFARSARDRSLMLATVVAAASLFAAACSGDPAPEPPGVGAEPPTILATTSIWADVVSNVACDGLAEVATIIPVGSDPHGYEPSLQDTERMTNASLIVANGLTLEGRLVDTLDAVAESGTPVLNFAEHMDPIPFEGHEDHDEEGHDDHDDHEGHDHEDEGHDDHDDHEGHDHEDEAHDDHDDHDHDHEDEAHDDHDDHEGHDHEDEAHDDHEDEAHDDHDDHEGHDHEDEAHDDHEGHDHEDDDHDDHEGHDHEDEAHDDHEGHDHEDDDHDDHEGHEDEDEAHDDHDDHEGHDHEDEAHDDHEDEGHHDHAHGAEDPHVWFDPHRVAEALPVLAQALTDAGLDPAAVEACMNSYRAELEAVDAEIAAKVAQLPAESRKLVTNHDAYEYFAARYGFEVIGTVIPSLSSMAEANPAGLEELAEIIEHEGIKAIFAETQHSGDDIEALAGRVGDVDVVTLYTGSLGPPGSGAETYTGFLRTNTDLIVDSLN